MNKKLIKYLRSDHAGETGAIYIYIGIIKTSACPKVIEFAKKHLLTEKKHLKEIERLLSYKDRSKLLFIWKFSGFVLGAVCGWIGPKWVYHSIEKVETFVEAHYQEQIDYLSKEQSHSEVLATIKVCQADEIDHKVEAGELLPKEKKTFALNCWLYLINWGSKQAVKIAKTF